MRLPRGRVAAQQSAVFVPNEQYYCATATKLPSDVSNPGTFACDVRILRVAGPAGVKHIFCNGLYWSHGQRNFEVELSGDYTPELTLMTSSGLQLLRHTSPIPDDGQWHTLAWGWDGTNAWIDIDDAGQSTKAVTYAPIDTNYKFIFCGASSLSPGRGYEMYELRIGVAGGQTVILYQCDSDANMTAVNSSNALDASAYDATVYDLTDTPTTGLAQAPSVPTPEEPGEPGEPEEKRFTATCSDPTATFTWECDRDRALGGYYPVDDPLFGLSDYTISGDNSEFLDVNSATIDESADVIAKAHTDTFVEGKASDPVRLNVFDASEPPPTAEGVLFQMHFGDAELGRVECPDGEWRNIEGGETNDPVNDPQRLPGIDLIRQRFASGHDVDHQVEIVDGAAYGAPGDKVLVVKEGIKYDNFAQDMNITMQSHLTGDPTLGYDELYIRYNMRFPDNFRYGWTIDGPDSRPLYWKWFRLRQNVAADDPQSLLGENRQAILSVAGGVGYVSQAEPHFELYNDSNEEIEGVASAAQNSPGGVNARFGGESGGTGQPPDPDNPVYGNLTAIGGPLVTSGDASEIGFFQDRAQQWHTVEIRVKLASDAVKNDGVFQMWIDGVEQGWTHKPAGPDSNRWHHQSKHYSMTTAWYDEFVKPEYETMGLMTAGSSVSHQGQQNSGFNGIYLFDNIKDATQFWHNYPGGPSEAQDGGRIYKDIVVSTSRIGADYEVTEAIDNRIHKQVKSDG